MSDQNCEPILIGQGVLALRFGEYRQYFPYNNGQPPIGDYVYAVALVDAPLPPSPTEGHAEGLGLVCCGRTGVGGLWGYIQVEKDTKQLIAAELCDLVKAKSSEWLWLRLTMQK